ncbi:acyl-CoA dehydrogenase [Frankia sp. EI5c]|uniref:acyl-CoA dehydrogenase family protein n=1 Tax=Frankia sp. EI5c TaxID=683316 RepID=UPI0007C3496B|nr:acyl-CoA dehydrogenase family protein [Frankia sp. EI5c]OAA27389.1 acyl-CoA dehydrogenase [Frankia sp. EI5c]
MRIDTAERLDRFRAEVRAFIAEYNPGPKRHTGVRAPEPELVEPIRGFTRALFDAGYLGADWPERYGGRAGHDPREAFVVAEEIARAGTWGPIGAGPPLAAPALITFGTPEQRAHYLPRIRSAEHIWCQLFSEPGAGSDLAGLSTRAVRDGDHWRVSGQKVWTTNGHHADVGYLLARTDPDAPKHAGISAFILDMSTPGVDVRPLREITGTSDFNEVFLDDVHIPAANLIGRLHDGWRVANSSLLHERSGVAAGSVELVRHLDDLLALGPTDPATTGRIATAVLVSDAMSKAVQSHILAGTEDAADAAAVKIFFSETNLALAEAGLALQGPGGLAAEGDPEATADGWWQDAFLYARAYTIAGGATEVLKNVIAERALRMPREPR